MAMAVDFSGVPGHTDASEHDVSGVYLKFITLSLELVRDSLTSLSETASTAQEAKTKKVQESIQKALDSIKAMKSGGFLRKLVQAFTFLAVIFSIAVTMVTLSPMAMAALAATLFMTLEPLISNAAGAESLTGQAMNALVQPLVEKFGAFGGVAIALTAIVVACLAVAGMGKLGANAMAASTNMSVQRARDMLTSMSSWVRSMGGSLTPAQQASLTRFLEVSSSLLMVAQGSMTAALAQLEFEGAHMMADAGDLRSEADAAEKVISKLINTDAAEFQQVIRSLLEGVQEYYN